MTPIPAGRWWDRVPSTRTPAVSRGIGSLCKKGVECVTVELSYYLRRSKVCELSFSPNCCVRGAHVPCTRAYCPLVDLVGQGKRPRNKKIIASGIKQWYAKDSRRVGRRGKWPVLQQVATITGLSFRQGIEAGYAPRWWKPACCSS